jgi:hypothetical protein
MQIHNDSFVKESKPVPTLFDLATAINGVSNDLFSVSNCMDVRLFPQQPIKCEEGEKLDLSNISSVLQTALNTLNEARTKLESINSRLGS